MNTEAKTCHCNPCVGATCNCGCQTPALIESSACQCGCQQGNACRCGPDEADAG
jgi:hypothetical protein